VQASPSLLRPCSGTHAHVIADLENKPNLPAEQAIGAARGTRRLDTQRSQIVPQGDSVITYWYYS
jgi:hypothetical protein